jgi:alkanesulfonate monooxygenase SsuD/methylene tetrahydromethanopterin reductase-like flavin-dependent oxidoreductase (luciferase family)
MPGRARRTIPAEVERSDVPLFNENRFKLGVFSFNVSYGTTMTFAEGTVTPTWEENVRIAQAADSAGWEFLLPLGRWRGWGGKTNFNDKTFDVYTWAAGISAVTTQIQVLTTAHVRLVHPVMAAKQGTTIDHISGGRSGLNIVTSQKAAEVAMFGIEQIEHDEAYEAGEEWITIVKRLWAEEDDFDFEGKWFRTAGAHAEPKPLQRPRPVIVTAGMSPIGRRFGAKHADFIFQVMHDLESMKGFVDEIRDLARAEFDRRVGTLIHATVVCADTEQEARDYYRYYVDELGDWEAAEDAISVIIGGREQSTTEEQLRTMQRSLIAGFGGYPLIGTPEQIVDKIDALARCGVDGAALHWVNYEQGIAQFNEQVLPLMIEAGLRKR